MNSVYPFNFGEHIAIKDTYDGYGHFIVRNISHTSTIFTTLWNCFTTIQFTTCTWIHVVTNILVFYDSTLPNQADCMHFPQKKKMIVCMKPHSL